MKKKSFSLLVLLLMGSASMIAQGDEFGEVPEGKYSNTMNITGYARLGDVILDEASIVAVFCGDEVRGKCSPVDDGSYSNILYLDIYGDNNGDKLIFKVLTEGRVIELDQGLTYKNDEIIGSPASPYYLDFPAPVVTKTSAEGWATTCLPFNAKIPDGVTAYAATGIEDRELQLSQYSGTILPADTPVLLQSEPAASTFEWLSILATADKPLQNILSGTTAATPVEANSVLTLGHDSSNELGFWRYTGTTIPANRAYITADQLPADVKGLTWLEGDSETGIESLSPIPSPVRAESWYSLDGRKAKGIPTQRGIYIRNGVKAVVK